MGPVLKIISLDPTSVLKVVIRGLSVLERFTISL